MSFPLSFPAQPCGEDPAWRPALRRRAWSVPSLGHGERGRAATHHLLAQPCSLTILQTLAAAVGSSPEGLEKIDLCRSVLCSMATASSGARPQAVCFSGGGHRGSGPRGVEKPDLDDPIDFGDVERRRVPVSATHSGAVATSPVKATGGSGTIFGERTITSTQRNSIYGIKQMEV